MTRPIVGLHPGACLLALVVCQALLAAAEPERSPAQVALEHAAAAQALRLDLAREASVWTGERQRLEALIAATGSETQRLLREAAVAERVRQEAEARLAALGTGSDLDALRLRLAGAGGALARGLAGLAVRLPPGAVAAPSAVGGEAGFDAAVRALEATEHAAGAIAVEIVTGRRDGRPEAVKLLRVAGAAAWWVSLDGLASGTVCLAPEGTILIAASDPAVHAAITAALGQVEGRVAPAVSLLPGAAP